MFFFNVAAYSTRLSAKLGQLLRVNFVRGLPPLIFGLFLVVFDAEVVGPRAWETLGKGTG